MRNKRNRTLSEHIGHGLYLYFLGLSLRNVARALSFLHIVRRSRVAIWQWIQKHKPKRKMASEKRGVPEYLLMRPLSRPVRNLFGFGLREGPKYMRVPALSTSKEKKMFAAEGFISGLVGVHLTMKMNKMQMDEARLDYDMDTVIDTKNIIPSGTRQNPKPHQPKVGASVEYKRVILGILTTLKKEAKTHKYFSEIRFIQEKDIAFMSA